MSRRRKNPFGELIATIKPVSGAYFGSFGCVSPNLSPISQQEVEKRQAQITELMFRASERLAKKLNITPDEARTKYFTQKLSDGTEIAPLNFLDDLNPEEKTQFLMLQREPGDVEIRAATLFMQYRLAHDLHIAQSAKPKAKQLYVKEPWFAIERGDRFRFPSQDIIVTSPYDPESQSIDVEPIERELIIDDVGFLLTKDGLGYALGDKTWTEEDTRALLIAETSDTTKSKQIQSIYKFYQSEIGRITEEPEQDESNFTKTGSESSNSSTPLALTGEVSTGNSPDIKPETNGLVTKTLETVPIT